MNTTMELPESKLTKAQVKTYGPEFYTEGRDKLKIVANVRYDDQCGNGHNSFSITADITTQGGREVAGGMCHDDIKKHFPQLAPFLKWHLTSSDGPMHYIANAVYHAGHCKGMHDAVNMEHLKSTTVYGALETDSAFDIEDHLFSPSRSGLLNETKEQALKDWMAGRLPALLAEFKKAVEALGFTY